MLKITTNLRLTFVIVAIFSLENVYSQKPNRAESSELPFRISKETTFLTRPLPTNGHFDFASGLEVSTSQGVTPDNNAYVLLLKAVGPRPDEIPVPDSLFERLGIPPLPFPGEYVARLERTIENDEDQLDRFFEQAGQALGRPWQKREFPLIAKWLGQNQIPLAKVVQATTKEQYFRPRLLFTEEGNPDSRSHLLATEMLSDVFLFNLVNQMLCSRAMLNIGEANQNAAWKDLIASWRLARLMGRGRNSSFDEALTAHRMQKITYNCTLNFIRYSRPSSNKARALQRELLTLPPPVVFSQTLNFFERIACLESVAEIASNSADVENRLLGTGYEKMHKIIVVFDQFRGKPTIDWNIVLKTVNHWYDRFVIALKLTDFENRQAAIKTIIAELKVENSRVTRLLKEPKPEKSKKKLLSEMMGSVAVLISIEPESQIKARSSAILPTINQQWDRNLAVALALAAYRSDTGHYPARLDYLSPEYLETIPLDLFSGQPLHYQSAKKGYLLSSVGPDRQANKASTGVDSQNNDDVVVNMQPAVQNPKPN